MSGANPLAIIIAPLAALLGVGATLAWNGRQERLRRRADMDKALWDARKVAAMNLLVAVNQAADSTRAKIASGLSKEELEWIKAEKDPAWSHAFERYLEASVVFPKEGERLCWEYLQEAYAWRRKAVDNLLQKVSRGPAHEKMTEKLGLWMMPEI